MTEQSILVADDSPEDCELLRRAFDEIGFKPEIVITHDGEEALEYLFGKGRYAGRDKTVAPLLTILDLKMPKVGGLEVLKRLRADSVLTHLAVVIMTSSDEERDKLEAQRLRVAFYFNKPFDFDGYIGLARRIQGMLAHLDER